MPPYDSTARSPQVKWNSTATRSPSLTAKLSRTRPVGAKIDHTRS
jgi:hypothetical protein